MEAQLWWPYISDKYIAHSMVPKLRFYDINRSSLMIWIKKCGEASCYTVETLELSTSWGPKKNIRSAVKHPLGLFSPPLYQIMSQCKKKHLHETEVVGNVSSQLLLQKCFFEWVINVPIPLRLIPAQGSGILDSIWFNSSCSFHDFRTTGCRDIFLWSWPTTNGGNSNGSTCPRDMQMPMSMKHVVLTQDGR